MAIWDDIFTGYDREVYDQAGYGERIGFGKRPALLIIDINYPSIGDKPEPVLESIKRFPQSCGEVGWKAIGHLVPLLTLAREKKIPIVHIDRQYPYNNVRKQLSRLIRKWDKLDFKASDMGQEERGHSIVKEIAPTNGELVILKEGASAFFGTALTSLLNRMQIDTLLVSGCTTSGCVRASVIDAAQYGFRVAVIEECVFDRIQISHKVNLFDINAKYGDVISAAEAKDYLSKL